VRVNVHLDVSNNKKAKLYYESFKFEVCERLVISYFGSLKFVTYWSFKISWLCISPLSL